MIDPNEPEIEIAVKVKCITCRGKGMFEPNFSSPTQRMGYYHGGGKDIPCHVCSEVGYHWEPKSLKDLLNEFKVIGVNLL